MEDMQNMQNTQNDGALTSDELFDKYVPIAEKLISKSALDVDFIDARGALGITDLFVIASSRSEIHLDTIKEEAKDALEDMGLKVKSEGEESNRWRLLDAGDVVVHLFSRQAREFYELERIWPDAARRHFEDEDTD